MIQIKSKDALLKMKQTGKLLANLFDLLKEYISEGESTLNIDNFVSEYLKKHNMISCTKGYMGYKHSSCISVNDVVVHGIPSKNIRLKKNDLVKVDISASFNGYSSDMARCFFLGDLKKHPKISNLINAAQNALDAGISQAQPGNHIGDISAAIQEIIEKYGYGIVREFAGHGIGKKMHEEPEILNYGKPKKGPVIKPGMAFAIEPMITMGDERIFIANDRWSVKTQDKGIAAHVEDTVIITDNGPEIITRNDK